jgi:hypothetical protein
MGASIPVWSFLAAKYVIAGLDPAIHLLRDNFFEDGYAGQARVR